MGIRKMAKELSQKIPKRKNTNRKKNKDRGLKAIKKRPNSDLTHTMTSSNFKTVVCEFFKKGSCQKGNDCTFSHDYKLKVLDTLCKFYLSGNCLKKNCLFSHDTSSYPCKYPYIGGKCDNMLNCKFSHQQFES